MKRIVVYVVGMVALLLLLLLLSVRIENLEDRRLKQRAEQFDAAEYARDLWDRRLSTVLDQAGDAGNLLHLFNTDMTAAIAQGRTLGESRVHAYLLKGRGTVVSLSDKGLALSVTEPAGQPEILIVTGAFVSGNAVRDASGLVNVSDFSESMKFNRISFEINRILVQEVIGPFMADPPTIGRAVRFVGAAEVVEDATEKHDFGDSLASDVTPSHHLLKVVPIRLALE